MTRELESPLNARLTIRLGALARNFKEAQRRAGAAAVAPVVKANAYSLGVDNIAPRLGDEGADTFFVARLQEGVQLRASLPKVRIFVLDGASRETAPVLVSRELIPVVSSLEQADVWAERARAEKKALPAALHVDTGMNRLGIHHAELAGNKARLSAALGHINLVLIMSHLACADEPEHALNRIQLERFRAALAMLPAAPASLAASAGIELGPEYHFDLVRPGLGLYGGNPVPAQANPYETVAVLTAPVLKTSRVDSGESVGYGASFIASRPSRLAAVAIGYADGLMRANAATGGAFIKGKRVSFAGRISMDLSVLDVSDLPDDAANAGTEAEFLGDHVSLEELAAASGTNTHEVLTSLSARLTRIYEDA